MYDLGIHLGRLATMARLRFYWAWRLCVAQALLIRFKDRELASLSPSCPDAYSTIHRLFELCLLQCWERMHQQAVDSVLDAPQSHAHEPPEIHDRCIHDAFRHESLNAMQEGYAFGFIALVSLLLAKLVNVRIGAEYERK